MLVMVAVGACAYYTRPVREMCFPREQATQAVGRMNAIGEQVLHLQSIACKEGRTPQADCDKQEAIRREMRAARRDSLAAVSTPGYEMNWDSILKTLELVGKVLDTIP